MNKREKHDGEENAPLSVSHSMIFPSRLSRKNRLTWSGWDPAGRLENHRIAHRSAWVLKG
jgi:hypothetical protein